MTVTDGLCPRNLLYCGFDEDVCNWSNDIVGDHINWVIESGQEEDLTGPKTDALGDVQGKRGHRFMSSRTTPPCWILITNVEQTMLILRHSLESPVASGKEMSAVF